METPVIIPTIKKLKRCSICKSTDHNKRFHSSSVSLSGESFQPDAHSSLRNCPDDPESHLSDLLPSSVNPIQEDPKNNVYGIMPASELKSVVNTQIVKELVGTHYIGMKDTWEDRDSNLAINPDSAETFIKKATDGSYEGKGHGAIDVKAGDKAFDVASLCINGTRTNEKSMMQKLKGSNLDELFVTGQHDFAIQLFGNDLYDKLTKCSEKLGLTQIYYIIFISSKEKIWLVGFKLNIDRIKEVKSAGFTSDEKCTIKTNGFISPKYGGVVLYKAKKRLELRLTAAVLSPEYAVEVFSK